MRAAVVPFSDSSNMGKIFLRIGWANPWYPHAIASAVRSERGAIICGLLCVGLFLLGWGRCGLGQERVGAEFSLTESPLRFQRVYVLADRPHEWPKENVVYSPVAPGEFEKVLNTIATASSVAASTSSAYLRTARYYARLVNDNLVDGQAVLEVVPGDESQERLVCRPMEPLSLAIGPITWADRDGQPARSGRAPGGRHKVVIDGAGVLMFSWRASGLRNSDGSVQFSLRFPAAGETRVTIDAPATLIPVTSALCWLEQPVAEGYRRWIFCIGGRTELDVSFALPEAVSQKPRASWNCVYELALQGVELTAEVDINFLDKKVDKVEINLPPELALVSVTSDGSNARVWALPTEEGESNLRQFVVEFSPPLAGVSRRVTIRALAPSVVGVPWALPLVQSGDLAWQQTRIELRVRPPLRVVFTEVVGGHQYVGDEVVPTGGRFQFLLERPDGEVKLQLALPPAMHMLQVLTMAQISALGMTAEQVIAFESLQGETWQVRATVSPGWAVDSVDSPEPSLIRFWEVESPVGGSQAGAATLRVDFSRPVIPNNRLIFRVRCRQMSTEPASTIAQADLVPLRWQESLVRREWLSIQADRPWRWDPMALVELADESNEVLTMLRTVVGLPQEENVWLVRLLSPVALHLPGKVDYSGWGQTEVTVTDHGGQLKIAVVCLPEATARIEQIALAFGSHTELAGSWQVRTCTVDLEPGAHILKVSPGPPLPFRLERRAEGQQEVWYVLFDFPVAEPVLLEHTLDFSDTDRFAIWLPWLPEAKKQNLIVGVDTWGAGLLLEGVAEVIHPTWDRVLMVVDSANGGRREHQASARIWFRYAAPASAEVTEGTAPKLTGAAKPHSASRAWIWSAHYHTIFRPGQPLRQRAVLTIETGGVSSFLCRWPKPVKVLGLSVGKQLVFSPVAYRHPQELLPIAHELARADLPSENEGGTQTGMLSGSVRAFEQVHTREKFLVELPVSFPQRSGSIVVDVLWEELPSVGGTHKLAFPEVSFDIPVLTSVWTTWVPPGWEIQKPSTFRDLSLPLLARRLFGGWVRPPDAGIFDPFQTASWKETFLPGVHASSELKVVEGWSLAWAAFAQQMPLRSPEESQGKIVTASRIQTTWGQLLKIWGSAPASLANQVQGFQSAERPQSEYSSTRDTARFSVAQLWVDIPALAACGITPATPLELPRRVSAEEFLGLLARHGLSLIVHPQVCILTTRWVTESLRDELKPLSISSCCRWAGQLAFADWPRGTRDGGQRAAPSQQKISAPKEIRSPGESELPPSGSEGSGIQSAPFVSLQPTPLSRVVVGVSSGRLNQLLKRMSAGQAPANYRLVPAALWNDLLSQEGRSFPPVESGWADVIPRLGWRMELVSFGAPQHTELLVINQVTEGLVRVLAAMVALTVVCVLGLTQPWISLYWLAAGLCLAVGWLAGGLWGAGAGGWLAGEFLGAVLAALWSRGQAFGSSRDQGPEAGPPHQQPPLTSKTREPEVCSGAAEEPTGRFTPLPSTAAANEETGICRFFPEESPKQESSRQLVEDRLEGISSRDSGLGADVSPVELPSSGRLYLGERSKSTTAKEGEKSGASLSEGSMSRTSNSPSMCTGTTLNGGIVAVLFSLLAVLGAALVAGAEQISAHGSSPTFRVLIPVDEQGRPTGEKYQVPEPLWTRLTRLLAEANERYLMPSVRYRAQMVRSVDGATWTIPEVQATLEVDVLQAPCFFPLPFAFPQKEEVPSVYVNGRPEVVIDAGGEAAPAVELSVAGLNEIQVVLRPTVWREGQYFWLRLPIPAVPGALFQLFASAGAPAVEVVKTTGPVVRNVNLGATEALLGPVDELLLRWSVNEETFLPTEVRALMLLSVGPDGITADLALRFGESAGGLPSVDFELDPAWRLAPESEGAAVPIFQSYGEAPRFYRWQTTVGPGSRLLAPLRFVHRQEDFVGQLFLPFVRFSQVPVSVWWVGFVASPPIQIQPVDLTKTVVVTPSAFVEAWGEVVPNLAAVWGIAPGGSTAFWVRRLPGKFSAKEYLQLFFETAQVRLQYVAQVEMQNEPIVQYALTIPPDFVVDGVEVEDSDTSGSISFFRASPEMLVLELSPVLLSGHRLRVLGTCLLRTGEPLSLPVIRLIRPGIEPLRVDLWSAFGVVLSLKPGVPLQPQPLTPLPLPDEGRFLGSLELERGQEAHVQYRASLDCPRIMARQVTRLERGREGWSAEVVWLVEASDGSVSRLFVKLPRWAVGSPVVDPSGEFRVINQQDSSSTESISPALLGGGSSPVPFGEGKIQEPNRTKSKEGVESRQGGSSNVPEAGEEIVAQIEFQRPFTGSRVVRLGRLSAPGVRMVQVPIVKLLAAETTEHYFLVSHAVDYELPKAGAEGLFETQMPREIAELFSPSDYRCFQVDPGLSRLVILVSRGEPLVRSTFVRGILGRDGRFVAVVQWDVDPVGNDVLLLDMPTGVTVLAWDLPGGYVRPAASYEAPWQVCLPHPVLPTVLTLIVEAKTEVKPLWWFGCRYRVEIPSFRRGRVRETLWMVAPPTVDARLEVFSGEDWGAPLEALSPKTAALERLRSLVGILRIATAELPALVSQDHFWKKMWQAVWEGAQAEFLQVAAASDGGTSDADRDYLILRREVEKLLNFWPVSTSVTRLAASSRWSTALENLPHLRQDLGPLYYSWVDPKSGNAVVLVVATSWGPGFVTAGLVWLLVGACGVVAFVGRIRSKLVGSLRRWPLLWLAAFGLAWWLWLQPSIIGFLVMLGAAIAGVVTRGYMLAVAR